MRSRVPVSIIILAHDRWGETRRCLRSLKGSTEPGRYEVLVCDNASTDATLSGLRRLARGWPQLRVFHNERNLPFAQAMNLALRSARGRHLLWLNNDTELSVGWLEGLLAAVESGAGVAAAGPMTDRMSPPQQRARPFRTALPSRVEDAPFLGGFCLLLKRRAAEDIGLLDERFVWGWEDVDYCLRLRQAGARLVLARDVFVRHAGSRTMQAMPSAQRSNLDLRNRRLIMEKWGQAAPWRGELDALLAYMPPPAHPYRPRVSVLLACTGAADGAAGLASWRRFARDPACEVLAVAAAGSRRFAARLDRVRKTWPELKVLGPWPEASYAEAVNRAAAKAGGDYLAICDARTVVRAGWLESLLQAAQSRPDAGVVRAGRSSCWLMPRRAWERVGGFDERFAGALVTADYCLRALQAGLSVVEADGSPFQGRIPLQRPRLGLGAKDRDLAMRKWLDREWAAPQVQERLWKESLPPHGLRPAASVIVLCQGDWQACRRCLESVREASGGSRYEVLAASLRRDCEASAGLRALARAWPQLRVLGPWATRSRAHGINMAARAARGDHLVVLREDVAAAPGWLEGLLAAARTRPSAGVLAPACQGADLGWQRPGPSARMRRVRYVRDHCLLIPRWILSRVGDLDERFSGGLWAEDFCFRVWQKGFQVSVAGRALVRWQGRGDGRARRPGPDLKLLFHKWAGHPSLDPPARRP